MARHVKRELTSPNSELSSLGCRSAYEQQFTDEEIVHEDSLFYSLTLSR